MDEFIELNKVLPIDFQKLVPKKLRIRNFYPTGWVQMYGNCFMLDQFIENRCYKNSSRQSKKPVSMLLLVLSSVEVLKSLKRIFISLFNLRLIRPPQNSLSTFVPHRSDKNSVHTIFSSLNTHCRFATYFALIPDPGGKRHARFIQFLANEMCQCGKVHFWLFRRMLHQNICKRTRINTPRLN